MWMLVDGNQWFHADHKGGGTKAPDYFMRRVHDVKQKYKFDRVVIAFDSPPSWRLELLPTYKSGRPENPQEFYDLFEVLKGMVADSPYEMMEEPTMEADDLIGRLVADAIAEGVKAMVCSRDRDMHQLLVAGQVSQCLKVERDWGGAIELHCVTAAGLLEKYGVHPWQWVEYRAVTGDSSDCIRGCNGVGPDTIAKVLSACGTLERFAASPFAVKLGPKTRDILLRFIADGLEANRRLIVLPGY